MPCLWDPLLGVWLELPALAPCFKKFLFSLKRSFEVSGGRLAPWTTSLLTSLVFVVSSAYFALFEEVWAARGALGGLPWISPSSEDAESAFKF